MVALEQHREITDEELMEGKPWLARLSKEKRAAMLAALRAAKTEDQAEPLNLSSGAEAQESDVAHGVAKVRTATERTLRAKGYPEAHITVVLKNMEQ